MRWLSILSLHALLLFAALAIQAEEAADGETSSASSARSPSEAGLASGAEAEGTDPAGTDAGAGFGGVRGRVVDDAGAAVPAAAVIVEGTELSATTGPTGAFEILRVPAGRRRLLVTRINYADAPVLVTVERDRTVEVPPIAIVRAEGKIFVVKGKLRASPRSVLMARRFEASTRVEMTRQEMSQKAGSDAAKVSSELPGVSTVDSKYVYVRGLGGRYSQTLVNGGAIPSPEPDKREIPLDLFPTNLLDSIAVVKTYSPDTPGEFSGGSVQIKTVGVPSEGFVNLGISSKYRHGTTFKDFLTYQGGNLDRFSFDDGTRELPGAVPSSPVITAAGGRPPTPEQVQAIGRSFPNIWNVETDTAFPDMKIGLSFGERIGKPGGPTLGIVGAINWGNSYQTVLGEERRVVANGGSRENPAPFAFSTFSLDRSTFESELSALLNLTWEIDEGQQVGLRNLYTRTAEDEAAQQLGLDGQRDADTPLYVERLRWVERSLFNTQAFGDHLLAGDTFLQWRASYGLSQRYEPDTRQNRYLYQPAIEDFSWENVFGSGQRSYYSLYEDIYDAAIDYWIPFRPFVDDKDPLAGPAPEQKIKLGTNFVYRDRQLESRLLRFQPSTSRPPVDEFGNRIDLTALPEDIFREKNIFPGGGFHVQEATRSTDSYEASQTLVAGYALGDFRLHEDWKILLGFRVESSEQTVMTTPVFGGTRPDEIVLDNVDPLPALNLIWEFVEDMQLRLGGSRTVSRPEFRELAPFEYTDIAGGWTAIGNPRLDEAHIWNVDLGWQWFPAPGDVVAANVFYKYFQEPIEQVRVPTSSQLLTTWDNAEDADLIGFEIEARKSLGFLNGITGLDLSDLSAVGNFTLMESEVRIGEAPLFQQTNEERPLQGQSPYLLNLGLLYEARKLGLSCALFVNTFGKRLSAVGAAGIDDEYEMPRWNLDLTISKTLGKDGKGGTLKLTAENLLDATYRYVQDGITTRKYRRGWAIGLGYSYNF